MLKMLAHSIAVIAICLSFNACALFGGGTVAKTPAQKRACSKKCVDAWDVCNKGCNNGGVVDRKCEYDCVQRRNDCVRPCR